MVLSSLPPTGEGKICKRQPEWLMQLGIAELAELGAAVDQLLAQGTAMALLNHTTLRARAACEDWPEMGRKRHLLRF